MPSPVGAFAKPMPFSLGLAPSQSRLVNIVPFWRIVSPPPAPEPPAVGGAEYQAGDAGQSVSQHPAIEFARPEVQERRRKAESQEADELDGERQHVGDRQDADVPRVWRRRAVRIVRV